MAALKLKEFSLVLLSNWNTVRIGSVTPEAVPRLSGSTVELRVIPEHTRLDGAPEGRLGTRSVRA
jgi:hypothetical protein